MLIPLYEPLLGHRERRYLNRAFRSGWISGFGDFIERFEVAFADSVDRKHAVAVCNGTVALHLALHALGIGRDDSVLTPSYTYVATANAATYVGATPRFFDSRPDNFQPSQGSLIEKISPTDRAAIVPHLFGYASDFGKLRRDLDVRGISLIEDCSEMLGAKLGGQPAGRAGVLATYSFFGNKTVTSGEGGMVVTDDDFLANRLRKLRSQAASKDVSYYFDETGFNFRMTNLQAAIGLAQLERLDQILAKKRSIFERYVSDINLASSCFLGDPDGGQSSFWLVVLALPQEIDRGEFLNRVRSEGVDIRPAFIPMHRLPMYSESVADFPGVEAFHSRIILLPSYPGLTRKQQKKVTDTVNLALEDTKRKPLLTAEKR